MDDLISRQAAIDAIGAKSDEIYKTKMKGATFPHDDFFQAMVYAETIVKNLPSIQPDHIAKVSKKDIPSIFPTQMSETSDKQVSILADALDGCPLTDPCDRLWAPHGWCEEHCGENQQEPSKECWLKYAEVMASEG